MSGLTPRRIRSRTSEFTEFFRAKDSANQTKFAANDVSTQSQATTHTLDVPSTSTSTSSDQCVTKKKSTRIPFLGRQRKKSNPNQSASERESTDVGEQWNRSASTDRRPTVEIPEPLPQVRPSPIAAASPAKTASTSLGSKLAATFNPRARKLSAVGSQSTPPVPSMPKPDTLSPPNATNTRGASIDSAHPDSRSLTPQPLPPQPTITISPTPEDLSEFKDLFTYHSKYKRKPAEADTLHEPNTASSYPTPSASPAASPRIPATGEQIQRRGSDATSTDSPRQQSSRIQRPEPSASKASKPSRRASPTEKEESSSSTTPRNSDSKDSRLSSEDKIAGPPVQRRPSGLPVTPAAEYSAQQRLRLRQQSTLSSGEKKSRPPSIPLPQTPSSPSQPSPPPSSADVTPSSIPRGRSRAGTVSSVNSLPPSSLAQPVSPRVSEGDSTPKPEGHTFDIDSATPEQLREAVRYRDRQCDELASSLAKIMGDHATEKAALEQKVAQLEKDMSKKDNQIKGLMWLVAHGKNPPATDFPSKYDLPALPTNDSGSISGKLSASKVPSRRSQLSDDSEYPTSGAESLRSGSDLSGNESSSRRRMRRPYTLADGSHSLYRSITSKRSPPPNSALPELPPHATKRSSISSSSLSPASSTSSLLPPSPSVTISSLSSIPEAPSSLRYSSKLVAHETFYHEDRQIRAANRVSTSSMASSSTAASSAYASNLKRSRPPSIAQVLEHIPQRG